MQSLIPVHARLPSPSLPVRDPAYADVKLAQAQHLLQQLVAFRSSLHSAHPASNIHVIIGGDFNSLPGSEVRE